MTEEMMKVAHDSLMNMIKEISRIARERNVEFNIDHVGPVLHYPNRFMDQRQIYRLETLVPMAMVAAASGKEFLVQIVENGREKFVQPYIDFKGTEPTMDSVFIDLNKSLSKFVEENPCADMKVAWRYAPSPTMNQSQHEVPYAMLSNLYYNGAFTDVNFDKEVLFYFVLQNRMKYELKTRVRPGGDAEYQYYGMHNELHEEFYGASRKLFDSVQSEMLKIVFKDKYDFEPEAAGAK